MAKVALIILMLFLSACEAIVPKEDLMMAERACEVNGGIDVYFADPITFDRVRCNNGALFDLIYGD